MVSLFYWLASIVGVFLALCIMGPLIVVVLEVIVCLIMWAFVLAVPVACVIGLLWLVNQ